MRFCRTQDAFAEESLQACRNIDGRDHASVLLRERSRRRAAFKGYPIPLNTKKRDCLVAYSHSAGEHFENAFSATIKSKYFMTVLSVIVTNMTATWRFDSTRFFNLLLSSPRNNAGVRASAKPASAARMPNQIDCRANEASVSLRSFAAPTALSDQRGLGTRADAQIGGGMRVGDAFQAMVRLQLMAK